MQVYLKTYSQSFLRIIKKAVGGFEGEKKHFKKSLKFFVLEIRTLSIFD